MQQSGRAQVVDVLAPAAKKAQILDAFDRACRQRHSPGAFGPLSSDAPDHLIGISRRGRPKLARPLSTSPARRDVNGPAQRLDAATRGTAAFGADGLGEAAYPAAVAHGHRASSFNERPAECLDAKSGLLKRRGHAEPCPRCSETGERHARAVSLRPSGRSERESCEFRASASTDADEVIRSVR